MPELPEVEAARRAIESHCAGKKIRRCAIADDSKVIDAVSPSDLESALVGKTILAALRKGKNLWLRLDSPPFPSFQFGMTGAFLIKGVAITEYKRSAVSDKDEWPSKFSKVFMELEDGLELSFTDKRRFARVRLLQDPVAVPPISELGPDALLEPLQIDEFVEALSKKKISIKTLLLDQSFVSGIGNWIADEVLYQARIHPLQIASSLSREDCVSLNRCIKEVIEKTVEVGADSSQYPSNWIFHSREKKLGKAFVDGKQIEFIAAGGRTSAFVPELQKLTGIKSAGAKPIRTRKATKLEGEEEEDDDNDNKGVEDAETIVKKESEIIIRNEPKKGSHKQQKETDDEEERPKGQKGKTSKSGQAKGSKKRSNSNEVAASKQNKARKRAI